MIPKRITDEVYNGLHWEPRNGADIDKELEGYNILGAQSSVPWRRSDGQPAIDSVTMFLQKPSEERIKVVELNAGGEEDLENPVAVSVAYID